MHTFNTSIWETDPWVQAQPGLGPGQSRETKLSGSTQKQRQTHSKDLKKLCKIYISLMTVLGWA